MPCEICGCEKSEAHHDDYSRPLDVRWLCRVHHLMHHGNYITQETVWHHRPALAPPWHRRNGSPGRRWRVTPASA